MYPEKRKRNMDFQVYRNINVIKDDDGFFVITGDPPEKVRKNCLFPREFRNRHVQVGAIGVG